MKKNLLFIGMIILGGSMIISSLILSVSIKEQTQLNGTFNGSLHMSEISAQDPYTGDILMPYEAGSMLGYSDWSLLIQDIENGNVEGIPYTKIGGNYFFSKKALEDWIYNMIIN